MGFIIIWEKYHKSAPYFWLAILQWWLCQQAEVSGKGHHRKNSLKFTDYGRWLRSISVTVRTSLWLLVASLVGRHSKLNTDNLRDNKLIG